MTDDALAESVRYARDRLRPIVSEEDKERIDAYPAITPEDRAAFEEFCLGLLQAASHFGIFCLTEVRDSLLMYRWCPADS